jgi:hypothetical protein
MRSFLQKPSIDPETFVDEVIASSLIPNLDPPSDFTADMKKGWEEHNRETARIMLLQCVRRIIERATVSETGELPAKITRREASRVAQHPYHPIGAIGAAFLAEYSGGYSAVQKNKRGRPSTVYILMSPDPPSDYDLAYILGPRGPEWEEWRQRVDEYREAMARREKEKAQQIQTEPPELAYAV